jgi:hypothetical protein
MTIKRYALIAPLLIVVLFFWSLFSSADDTILADYGKTVGPMKTNEIRMIEEEVVITVDDYIDKRAGFPLRRASVKCTFLLKNDSAKTIEATVGFPGNEQNTSSKYSEPIIDFVTVIDGQRFKIKTKKEILKEDNKTGFQVFRNWYTWNMKFPANSTVKVDNSYLQYLSAPLSGYDPFYLNYELSTGANWKGKIGKATIKVIYKNAADMEKRVCDIKPKGWVRRQNEIVWNLQNIEPTQNDNISICERNLGVDYPESRRKPLLFKKE